MSVANEVETAGMRAERASARRGLLLGVLAVLALALAGLVLWARQGDTLFAAYLVSAVAGCF